MPLELILSFLKSRIANILVALFVGIATGWWKTDASWRQYEAQQNAAREVLHQMELAREAQNTLEIAKAATSRAEEDQSELQRLRKLVDDFNKGDSNAANDCGADQRRADFINGLRPRAATHRSHTKLTRPPGKVR